ncbi:MAG: hypothetical protein JWR26_1968 [Pedosphaera sp.]|nr:hypothetical protein [Pedosphaera sp.]
MASDTVNVQPVARQGLSIYWKVVYAIVVLFVAVLMVETAFRIKFPWDLYLWSESPFLTNMMKLEQHLPVYSAPADGNSFVYSPGLEYITFALLKPFGLELDIRFCRLVSVLLGLMASGFGALAVTRLTRSLIAVGRTKLFFFVTWGIIWLVLSKNFMADITHPDNLHAFHATLIFWLCITAIEKKRFGLAMLTMVCAGMGVLTKQTEVFCFLGPALAFAIFKPWGWARWLLLVAAGGISLMVSLHLLWMPEYGRFFTFDLPSHQGIWPTKSYSLILDMLTMDRSLLLCLGLIAIPCLWSIGGNARRYLVCWACVGVFAVLPNVAAYMKSMGMWNNLIIFQVWSILIVWPVFGMLVDSLRNAKAGSQEGTIATWDRRIIPMMVYALMMLFLLLLLPMKVPPRSGYYTYGQTIEASVKRDVAAGLKVLSSHGTEFLIHAGVKEVPRDRSNTLLEMGFGNVASKSEMMMRINAHYYDRIYLLMGKWYGPEIMEGIDKNYVLDSVVPSPPYKPRLIYGYGELMEDCLILSPRPKN